MGLLSSLSSMPTRVAFDHEKLDVYVLSIAFSAWVGELIDGPLSKRTLSAVKHLDGASTSIPLNIAEGNGKRSNQDRCRFLDIAKGSALESAACLDLLVARKALTQDQIEKGKAKLLRVVAMLSKLILKLLGPRAHMG